MFAAVVLIAVTSTFLGLFIAVSVSEVFEAQTFQIFQIPDDVPVRIVYPNRKSSGFIRRYHMLPLTYGADMLKYSVNSSALSIPVSLLILIGCSIAHDQHE